MSDRQAIATVVCWREGQFPTALFHRPWLECAGANSYAVLLQADALQKDQHFLRLLARRRYLLQLYIHLQSSTFWLVALLSQKLKLPAVCSTYVQHMLPEVQEQPEWFTHSAN